MHLDGLYVEAKYRKSFALLTLHADTRKKAKEENLKGITVLTQESAKGFVLMIHSHDLDEIIRIIATNRKVPLGDTRIFPEEIRSAG